MFRRDALKLLLGKLHLFFAGRQLIPAATSIQAVLPGHHVHGELRAQLDLASIRPVKGKGKHLLRETAQQALCRVANSVMLDGLLLSHLLGALQGFDAQVFQLKDQLGIARPLLYAHQEALHGIGVLHARVRQGLRKGVPLIACCLLLLVELSLCQQGVPVGGLHLKRGVDGGELVLNGVARGGQLQKLARLGVGVHVVEGVLRHKDKGAIAPARAQLSGCAVRSLDLLMHLAPLAGQVVHLGAAQAQPTRAGVVANAVARSLVALLRRSGIVHQTVDRKRRVARLSAHRCGHADDTVDVLARLGDRAAYAALLKGHPQAHHIGRMVVRELQVVRVAGILVGEVIILIRKVVLGVPTALDDLPQRLRLLAHRALVQVVLVIKLRVLIATVVIAVVAVFDVAIRIQATALVLGIRIAAQRIVRQPGHLLIGNAVLKDPAHILNGQLVKDILPKAILVAVLAEFLDDLIAHHGVCGLSSARPQARAIVHTKRGGYHHFLVDHAVRFGRLAACDVIWMSLGKCHKLLDGAHVTGAVLPPASTTGNTTGYIELQGLVIVKQPLKELGVIRAFLDEFHQRIVSIILMLGRYPRRPVVRTHLGVTRIIDKRATQEEHLLLLREGCACVGSASRLELPGNLCHRAHLLDLRVDLLNTLKPLWQRDLLRLLRRGNGRRQRRPLVRQSRHGKTPQSDSQSSGQPQAPATNQLRRTGKPTVRALFIGYIAHIDPLFSKVCSTCPPIKCRANVSI